MKKDNSVSFWMKDWPACTFPVAPTGFPISVLPLQEFDLWGMKSKNPEIVSLATFQFIAIYLLPLFLSVILKPILYRNIQFP